MVFHMKPGRATASELITICRSLFQTYGCTEELSSDGGSIFMSHEFQNFLSVWGVQHCLSSVAYPQSNGRAELAVKSAKRIIYGNTDPQGSLDTDKAARAVLQYRNTPIQGIGLSPAQLLLHRHLRAFIPARPSLYKPHPEWVKAASQREIFLSKRNAQLITRYNQIAHPLFPLQLGDRVALQNSRSKRWDRTGRIVEALADRQYRVRVDGSGRITLRNRRFLKRIGHGMSPGPIPSPSYPPLSGTGLQIPQSSGPLQAPVCPGSVPTDASPPSPPPPLVPSGLQEGSRAPKAEGSGPCPPPIPRALSRLLPHNQAGRQELLPSQRPGRGGRGKGDVEFATS